MRTRLIHLILTLLLISTAVSAQKLSKTDKYAIRERVGWFIKHTKELNYEGVLDLTYPKVYTLASRESMMELLSGMADLGMEMIVDEMDIKKVQGLHKAGNDLYALVKYDTKMRINVTGDLASELAINSLTMSFGNTYGSKNVKFDAEKSQFSIYGLKYMVLIKEEAYDSEWFIMEWNTEDPALISALLSPEVIKKATKRIN